MQVSTPKTIPTSPQPTQPNTLTNTFPPRGFVSASPGHGTARSNRSAEELCAWKSHIGVSLSSDRKIVRATATGWGRSGALTDALLTRTGNLEGFLATLPQNTASLFIGFSNLSGSLYDHSRAHQEDLDFSIRTASSGELSYQSKARMMQYAYSPHLESDTVCEVRGRVVWG